MKKAALLSILTFSRNRQYKIILGKFIYAEFMEIFIKNK